MKKIYYWSGDLQENSGEGILARHFLKLLKNKYTNYKFIKLNKFKKKNNLFYNYILPFWGILKIWKYHYKGNKSCYINYLPIWNFLIFLLFAQRNNTWSNNWDLLQKKIEFINYLYLLEFIF